MIGPGLEGRLIAQPGERADKREEIGAVYICPRQPRRLRAMQELGAGRFHRDA